MAEMAHQGSNGYESLLVHFGQISMDQKADVNHAQPRVCVPLPYFILSLGLWLWTDHIFVISQLYIIMQGYKVWVSIIERIKTLPRLHAQRWGLHWIAELIIVQYFGYLLSIVMIIHDILTTAEGKPFLQWPFHLKLPFKVYWFIDISRPLKMWKWMSLGNILVAIPWSGQFLREGLWNSWLIKWPAAHVIL